MLAWASNIQNLSAVICTGSGLPYNTVEGWAGRLLGGTVPGCVIQKSTAPWEASDWRGRRVRAHIAAVDQGGTAEAG